MGIKIRIVAVLLLLVFLGAFMAVLQHTGTIQRNDTTLRMENGKELFLSVAATDAKRARGLSGRESMRENEGMLFTFAKRDFQGIWMKEMRFPLDILWLNKEGAGAFTVVDIKENAAPETYPEIFLPKELASHVIELNGGTAGKNGIGIGSVLTVKK
ncbi:MAG: DUF192 domain-containing protein [Patescibacteria group bacterium]